MRPDQPWVQPNAANPLENEARILTSCHAALSIAATCEQEPAGLPVGGLQVIIDRLPPPVITFDRRNDPRFQVWGITLRNRLSSGEHGLHAATQDDAFRVTCC
jgi:hypothetical protein